MSSLDDILSGSATAPATEKQEATPPATEQAAELTTEQPDAPTEGETSKDGKPVPVGAIRQAEREKATKRYTEQVADFDKRLSEQNDVWERRVAKILEAAKPPQPQQQPPDFFENPNAAVLHTVAPEFDRFNQTLHYNSHLIASQVHTPEVVKTADEAFRQAYANGQVDPADARRVLTSPNIYDAAVRWHRHVQAQAEIGPDPVAYKERVKAELLKELETAQPDAQAPAAQNGAAPVMPSNFATARNVGARSGPQWSGPTPLKDIVDRPSIFKR